MVTTMEIVRKNKQTKQQHTIKNILKALQIQSLTVSTEIKSSLCPLSHKCCIISERFILVKDPSIKSNH